MWVRAHTRARVCVRACVGEAYVCSGAELLKVLLFLPQELQGIFRLTELLHARLPDVPQPRGHLDTQQQSEESQAESSRLAAGHGGAHLGQAPLHAAKVHDEAQLLGPAVGQHHQTVQQLVHLVVQL